MDVETTNHSRNCPGGGHFASCLFNCKDKLVGRCPVCGSVKPVDVTGKMVEHTSKSRTGCDELESEHAN